MEGEREQAILSEKHKGISRVSQDTKSTYGWYVRVRFKGITWSKLFSDKKCGGKYSSLLLTIEWRNKTEKKLGIIRTDKHMVTLSSSGTGVVGVRLNNKLCRYEVTWVNKQGEKGRTSVSIAKHGKREAFSRACAIRREKENARHIESK